MEIPVNILRKKLQNVYFIWGRGKTTIAAELHKHYGFRVYSTDEGKDAYWSSADPEYQPYMCRDFEREFGARSFWELPAEVIALRETHVQREVTPLLILDLLVLAAREPVVICEGDLDYEAVLPFASHAVHLCNRGTAFDWFDRPDHENIIERINKRTDIGEAEKTALIANAYAAVGQGQHEPPAWVTVNKVKNIDWDDSTGIETTTREVARYFGFE